VADFESGIRNFIVLRDGQELAQGTGVPDRQIRAPAVSIHDVSRHAESTDAGMRYVDASAKAGEQHTYSIITVNSVGLRSEASVQLP